MQICQALQHNKLILEKTSQTPDIDAEVLLCFVLNKPKEFLYTYPEYELSEEEAKTYQNCIKKRLLGAPIAHITGFKEFYGREFIVNKNTLVPRPETELFIDYLKNSSLVTKNSTFVDLGTGSGCIIITLAKELINNSSLETRHSKLVGVDISEKALDVAKQNAKKHKVDDVVKFYPGNLLDPLPSPLFAGDDSDIIITANLPYLTPDQVKNSPSIHAEPELALVAGDDGLKYYRKLFEQIAGIMNHESRIMVLCEIDDSQKESIKELVKEKLPSFSAEIKKDLAGLSRMVVITN